MFQLVIRAIPSAYGFQELCSTPEPPRPDVLLHFARLARSHFEYLARDPSETGNVETVGPMSDAVGDLVEKSNVFTHVIVLVFVSVVVIVPGRGETHVDVADEAGAQALCDAGEALVVGDEEGEAAGVADDVVEDGVGDGGAVVSAGAAAELVEQDEGARGGGAQDGGRLADLDHEGGLAGEEIVAGAHAGVDGVREGQAQRVGGHEGADLGQEDEQGQGTDKGRLAAHVGTGHEVG